MDTDLENSIFSLMKLSSSSLTSSEIKKLLEDKGIIASEKRIKECLRSMPQDRILKIQLNTNTKPSWLYIPTKDIEKDVVEVLKKHGSLNSNSIADILNCTDRHLIDNTLYEMKVKGSVEFNSKTILYSLVDSERVELIDSLISDIRKALMRMETGELRSAKTQLAEILNAR